MSLIAVKASSLRSPGDREVLGHAERYRAEPLGLPGELDLGEPFEQDADRDLTVEAREWRAKAEVCARVDGLRLAVGLGGRSRTATSDAERARVAVRKAITTALDRLAEHDTAFAEHLRIHVRTGIYCRYETDPTNPIEWDVST